MAELLALIFFALLIANAVLFIMGCRLFRGRRLAGWIGFSLWMLFCLGLAFLGLLGHGSLPPWRNTLQASWLLYVSFPVYAGVVLAWGRGGAARR